METRIAPVWRGPGNKLITAPQNYGLMGILNLTPDSFYDGGSFNSAQKALQQADCLLQSGADIVDIGARSTHPGSGYLDPTAELERLKPVLPQICAAWPDSLFSIDTMYASVADFALQSGAAIVNDVSGLEADPDLPDVLAQYKPAYVLMHNRLEPDAAMGDNTGRTCDADIVDELKTFFDKKLNLLASFLPEDHIVLDPGIGFGKTQEENLELLQRLDEFLVFGRPLLVGISMKSIFGHLLGLSLDEREESTSIASVILWQKGVFWHRVHNVEHVRNALILADKLDSKISRQP